MSDDPRVQELLEELLDSGATPEAVCRSCIELLPEVRARWQRVVRARAELDALFPPEADATPVPVVTSLGVAPFPDVPGYEVEAVLGTGGMGVVFKARHVRLDRIVALKMTLAGAYAGAHERERFQREAVSVAALRHPNIVQIHDVGDSNGRPYFTMEYVEGGSLAEKLAGTPLPTREAAALVSALAAAVHAAHASGIVHRDLKPGNVLLTADGTPKISDFGLARRLGGEAGLTRTGAALGTPSYMAPEQARGKVGAVGPPADVYALGAILYEMLTGRPPFRAESAAETVHQLLTQDPVPPSRLNGKTPRDLETICLKCLSKDPGLRYARGDALSDDLGRFLRGEAISARPEGRVRRTVRAVRRRPTLTVGVTAGVSFAALFLAAGVWLFFDWSFVNKEVTSDLEKIDGLLQKRSFTEAKTLIERAEARLGTRKLPDLRQRLNQRSREWALADRLEQVNLDVGMTRDGPVTFGMADKEYDGAFREFGIGHDGEDPGSVAARVRESRIRATLLAALDRWSTVAVTRVRTDWAMDVASRSEPEPTAWRTDARNKDLRRNRAALIGLIDRARVEDESAALLLALSASLDATNRQPPGPSGSRKFDLILLEQSKHQIPFLTKVQQAHPHDLWANHYLGKALLWGKKPDDAVRYFQVTIALRPRAATGYHYLGLALGSTSSMYEPKRYDEAILQLRKALALNPNSGGTHDLLLTAFGAAKKYDEVISHTETALRLNYRVAKLRAGLGFCLHAKGRVEESFEQFRLAYAIDPNDTFVQDTYRLTLAKDHRWSDLLPVWKKALEGDRPNHDDWYGYAEMCLYLGQTDEYRQARKALLAEFGTSDSPYVAERTARACLLLPLSGEEMSKVVSLADLAANADRKKFADVYPYFQFVRGFAAYRQGQFNRAIAIMRGDASPMYGPLPLLVLSMALHRTGKDEEARKTFVSAMLNHEWRENQVDSADGWIRHVLRREAERMIFPNLAAVLGGKQQPRDNDERLAQIGACRFENRFAALARIYAEAFATDPRLANGRRLAAARVAAQAGCGRGADARDLGEAERRSWRAQARTWLRADLSAFHGALNRDFNQVREKIREVLTAWPNDPELAGIREPAELEKLMADERADCQRLWADVSALLDATSKPK